MIQLKAFAIGLAAVAVFVSFAGCGGTVRTDDEEHFPGGGALGTGGKPATGGKPGNGGVTGKGGFGPGSAPGYGGYVGVGGYTSNGGIISMGGYTGFGGIISVGGYTGFGGYTTGTGGAATRSPYMYAKEFNQSCIFDTDCTTVQEGYECGCDSCPNAAINAASYGDWVSALGSVDCGVRPPCVPRGCPVYVAACQKRSGTCGVRTPVYLAPQNYDTTCQRDADCIAVADGDPCSACQCSSMAINVSSYKKYAGDVAAVDCSRPPDTCKCANETHAHCVIVGTIGDGGPSVGDCKLGARQ